MKRVILSVLALSMLAAPAAQAAERHGSRTEYRKVQTYDGPRYNVRRTDKKVVTKRGDKITVRKVERNRWARGHRVPDWQRRHEVRDYKRYGLYRPGAHQRWIKVDNDYLLIGISTGIIAGLIAAR